MCLFFNISAATEAELLHPRLSEGHKLLYAVTSPPWGFSFVNCRWFLYMKTNSSSQFSHSKCHINACDRITIPKSRVG